MPDLARTICMIDDMPNRDSVPNARIAFDVSHAVGRTKLEFGLSRHHFPGWILLKLATVGESFPRWNKYPQVASDHPDRIVALGSG